MIQFTVPGNPTAKGRPRFSTRGGFVRSYTPEKTRVAELAFAYAALPYKPKEPLSGALRIDFQFYLQTPRSWSRKRRDEAEKGQIRHITKPDADNLVKTCMDAMNGVFFLDDAQVVEFSSSKHYSDNPRTVVTIVQV